MNNDLQIRNSTAEFLIFATQNESDTIEVRFEENTLWLTQLTMAELFQSTKQNISQHIQTICETG
ncbi:MAG: phosphoribosylaminoimidazolesuccinocarboxamide synthase, partial [Victivallales bacterium]|nr:phosphoribosylaminoimidazolesuccinocarboxamide synthase [Victivallales bacterium]